MKKLLLALIGRDGNWHQVSAISFRRYVGGRWQYRQATQAEVDEWDLDRAW